MTTIFIITSVLLSLLALALYINLRNERATSLRYKEEGDALRGKLTASEASLSKNIVELSAIKAQSQAREEQRKESEAQQQRREAQLRDQFKSLATDIFTEQTKQFKSENRESIDKLLKPFQDNITTFRERVETIYSFENSQRGELKGEINKLFELNKQITTETINLTNALRGNSKTQGDWGEMILETILENSNLDPVTQYSTQCNFKDEAGNNLRPDVVIYLPDNKQIIIDAKSSLTAYINYVNAESAEDQRRYLDAHLVSVRQHIRELSNKEYQKLVNSPDFVIMFIPSEPAFLAALQADPSLWSEAYDKKVIVSSPTNLFAMLKLVADLWKRDAQNKNTEEIVKRGTKLYDQLVKFVDTFDGVGVALTTARNKYDEAFKRLKTGNDNLIRSGERLQKLGLPTKQRHNAKILESSEIEVDDEA